MTALADPEGDGLNGTDHPQGGEPGRGDARQFVIFHVQAESFAVALSDVQEIIRMPDVVRVPMSPGALEGLANLRGTVLPVVNLRHAFGFTQTAHDDSTRVVVLDLGRPVGMVVDRMANVVTVEASSIEPASSIQGTIDTDLLTGMIKADDGQSMVMILDAGQVIRREFKDLANRAETLGSTTQATTSVHRNEDKDVETATDEDQLVSFEVAEQEYAFPIEQVQEIVQMPDSVSHIPNAASHVLGVITLRNRLLPLVSLREMFGLPGTTLSEANKVVVVSLGGGLSVGVVMDSVKEVLRVNRSVIDPMPSLLSQDQSLSDIQSICRLQDGKRLVSVLSAERMFNATDLRKVIANNDDEAGMQSGETDEDARTVEVDDEEQFVVFRLMDEEYGVPIDAIQEIVRVPEELTRVPKTPAFIEGVINLRGVVLPVVDQRRRFGLSGIDRNDRQRIMVFTIRGIRTGFIVDSVSEVMRIPARFIGAAPDLSEEQRRLIRRVANLEHLKRMILLLEVTQLLNVQELDVLSGDAA
ncbi:chemotaxis protein CheW [Magnetospirillum molischianum]|uniref:Chemotaxis protein CheW n=1 Tax=Magnetospirillum molischianum DSM 120 TaxID=1150626 RepID=H8FVF6_MAGML|nr:chemotaxis protein CheW [Magnetospirillum molischianum]CCG42344.1 Chemotaxis CheW protein [Magnetospirillum molischianum DSM 120]